MFKELYYWMYAYVSKIKTNKTPAVSAYVIICVLQMANIGIIFVIINYVLKIDIDKNTAVTAGLASIAVLYILNYIFLYAKRKNIFQNYENTPPERKAKGQIYFWLYVILSFVIFIVAVANLVTPKY